MKKLFLGLALLFPLQALSADDSVYTWGTWSQGIQPAAGPAANAATPAPVQLSKVNIRPNENSAFNRVPSETERQVAGLTSLAVRSLNQIGVSVGAPTSSTGPSTGGF
jgi:hypothetical protein